MRYATVSPLAQQLFQIDGVTRVFYGSDFISVTKEDGLDWQVIKPDILSVITEHYTRGQPLFTEGLDGEEAYADTKILDTDSEALSKVKEIIQTRVRPFVQDDGGDIKLIGFDESSGIVSVEMKGSCAGCPSSNVTLKNGIENMLKHYVPGVKEVVAVEKQEEELVE